MRASLIETLESRQFLDGVSSAQDLVDALKAAADRKDNWVPVQYADPVLRTLPNIKRTYSGEFSVPSQNLTGTFTLRIRKEELRVGGYAALRGTLDITTNLYPTMHADMTYGKIRDNLRVNATLVSTVPAATATVFGKANTSGSQIKGQIDVTGAVTFSSTYVINKVVAG